MNSSSNSKVKEYRPLALAAGLGSMLGSGAIVGLSATIGVWANGFGLTEGQVGVVSASLTFAIAAGSLLAGQLTKIFGLYRAFNWLNLLYAIGALSIILAPNFSILLVGAIIMGMASGADLPISLTVVSTDSPDEKTGASLVSSTQIFWQIGVFISYVGSFVLSSVSGLLGARLLYGVLFIFAAITWIWRSTSPTFAKFHLEALDNVSTSNIEKDSVSIRNVFQGVNGKRYLGVFVAILVFYVAWNLLANTWGQFQTYALTNAGASQAQATGLGIILNVISLITTMIFSSLAAGKYRNIAFFIGILVQFGAMIGMATLGGDSSFIALAITIAFYNFGNPLAGEAIYKVWTQESFPVEMRASLQGFINGFSRLAAGLFAFVTPYLVAPARIQSSMYVFAGIVLVSLFAGAAVMKLKKQSKLKG